MGTFAEAWQPNPRPEQRHRRSLYVLRLRGLRDPFFEVFNQPAPDLSCELRDNSTITPQAFTLFNGEAANDRALALAARVLSTQRQQVLLQNPQRERGFADAAIVEIFRRTLGRDPSIDELQTCLTHWKLMTERHQRLTFEKPAYPREIIREAVEENTGEKFRFSEPLHMVADFVPDLKPADCSPELRGLAEVCLVLFNSNEFAYVE
jgi:hypothetical protein